MTTTLRIGTRKSPLALWQAQYVADRLRPICVPELVKIETTGDHVRELPLAQLGGQGVFTREIQRALLEGRVDVAVHSLKDLPTEPVEGLVLAAVPPRGPTEDVFVSQGCRRLIDLPFGAVLGTSSPRRRAQLLYYRRDLQLIELRGNVETRLRKLEEQGLDGIILAWAGLQRLGLTRYVTEVLDCRWMLPAVGQGALGIECRADDGPTRELLSSLDHLPTRYAVLAERALLRSLRGGCQVPVGACGQVDNGRLHLRAAVLDLHGSQRIADECSGPAENAEELGVQLAQHLLRRGALQLLPRTG